jgi:UDP-GlcNAc:undecaprenyl-phosphate GlcNAc-1-phosphate transferase
MILSFIAALLLTAILCLLLTPIARILGWVDTPDHRKQHCGDIPLAGGPAIILSMIAVMAWIGDWSDFIHVLAWSSGVVFLTGLVDDQIGRAHV